MARAGPSFHLPRPSRPEKPQIARIARFDDTPDRPPGVPQGAVCGQLARGGLLNRDRHGPDRPVGQSPAGRIEKPSPPNRRDFPKRPSREARLECWQAQVRVKPGFMCLTERRTGMPKRPARRRPSHLQGGFGEGGRARAGRSEDVRGARDRPSYPQDGPVKPQGA